MKKWLIALAALMLLLIPSVAMAEGAKEVTFFCFSCREERTGTVSDTYEYSDSTSHVQRIICQKCGYRGMTIAKPHTESIAATCQSAAYCNVCNHSYGDPAEHNWGAWTADPMTHKRTCQTPDCGAVDEGRHTSEPKATCKTPQTCGICNVQYKDMENHEGEVKTRYGYHSESEHKLESYCSGCGDVVSTVYEAHTESYQATCQAAAYCADCKSYYGSPNPDAHNWNEWQSKKSNPKLHYHYCWNFGCSASESEPHVGNSNCVTSATCSKCHATYKDTTKHAGPLTYTYEKIDESFHKRIETCTACGKKTGNQDSAQHEESIPADCAHAAWCNVCNQAYGDPNPDNHGWGNWTYENENQHYRICAHNESHIQHADHRGYATCIANSMPCLDCGCSYKDPGKHQGGTNFNYTNVSDTEHKVTVICGGCKGEIKTYQEGHSEHTPATCSSRAICAKCSTPFGDLAPNNHIGEATTTYVKTSETQHTAKITYAGCGHMVDGESTDHTETTAATCTAAAYCAVCESNYGEADPDAHGLESHDAKEATCTEIGWDAYETCSRCDYTTYAGKSALGHDYAAKTTQPTCTAEGYTTYTCTRCGDSYRDAIVSALDHWYGEWTPNADGTNSAACLRNCQYARTVPCTFFAYQLKSADQAAEFTLCPVCGEVSDGTRLMPAEAAAKAVTGKLPAGEIVVRMGELESGELLMSVAFEISGKLTQPTGQVKITLPGELLEGYTLSLLVEDGTETELTRNAQDGSFVLDFSGASSPVRVIRLVPQAA